MSKVDDIVKELRVDPYYNPNNTTPKEKLIQKAQELLGDMETVFNMYDNRSTLDILVQFEMMVALKGRPDLLGIMLHLVFFNQIQYFQEQDQVILARSMNLSEPTFKRKRDELVEMGLLDTQKQGKKIYFKINKLLRIHSFSLPKVQEERDTYITELQKKLVPINKKFIVETIKKEEKKQAELQLSAFVEEKIKKEKKKKIIKDTEKFSNEDYTLVIDAYKKYKRIGLYGPEVLRAKRAIKEMFKANKTPKQIIDCMKFFADNRDTKGFEWLRAWTLETVMKKIPEFLAGQLKIKTMEDEFERIV